MIYTQISLLDAMTVQMKCGYLSDLRFLSGEQRKWLAMKLERTPAETASLSEWNDALEYLTDYVEKCSSPAQAKSLLIARLSVGKGQDH